MLGYLLVRSRHGSQSFGSVNLRPVSSVPHNNNKTGVGSMIVNVSSLIYSTSSWLSGAHLLPSLLKLIVTEKRNMVDVEVDVVVEQAKVSRPLFQLQPTVAPEE